MITLVMLSMQLLWRTEMTSGTSGELGNKKGTRT